MKSLPDGLTAYKRTSTFTEATVPAGLLRDHKTAAGVWGVVHVTSGRLRYVIPSRHEEVVLSTDLDGIVEPEVPHHIAPEGPVSFYVEFWR
ncbi:MAG: DUF1971 domain-containing protein [Pseudomonadota bacterium]